MKLHEGVSGAIGPFEQYCDGYGNAGAAGKGYISVLKLQTGKVEADMDEVLEGIVSYDRAETLGTYVGQINMVTASSFCGLNGAVWGYHLARHEKIAAGTVQPLFHRRRSDGVEVPVYPVEPLLEAGRALFGTVEARRFPLLPGAHVNCAVKNHTTRGPTSVWCAIGLAIAEDRERDANLFVEDAGDAPHLGSDAERAQYLDTLMDHMASSIIRCGDDSGVRYREIYLGSRIEWVPEGHVGCALTCAPYVVLARKAVPAAGPEALLEMTIGEWKESVLPAGA